MWSVLLDLLAAARRPLVVVDFETAGLHDALNRDADERAAAE